MTDFNALAKQIHQQNVDIGWWDDPNRCIYECLQLVVTEVAEATEGERKNLMDDHLPHRKMGEVELADALIRILDIGGRLGLVYDQESYYYPCARHSLSKGCYHLSIVHTIIEFSDAIYYRRRDLAWYYTKMIKQIIFVGDKFRYDVIGALYEKLEYNKHRADHKREARSGENGKRF